ncbi:hypothetical protein DSO57_1012447 [Entomophthora muscae]|uniref:Uncharacterized protein n=1 Tax=Entomophthora muscae TaxID=34485 RepID=A0ACC2S7R0_9FUNG|nr:hypothetical protein DSO57_1012447 [Entomophthora muscae]
MSSSNSQVNKLFPGLDKIAQGYAGSSNSEASVYGRSQPSGPYPSTTQECVLSPVSSSMALFAHHAVMDNIPDYLNSVIKYSSKNKRA